MQGILADIGFVALRALILFVVTLVAVRISGKRSVGQLAPFDLAVIIIMGSVAALPLEDANISLLNGIVPLLVLAFLEYLFSVISVRWRGFEKVTQGLSTPVVLNGQVMYENLRRERVSEADLHIILRQAGADRVEDIALAVLEPTGQCSVIKKKESQPVTVKDMDLLTLTRLDAIRSQMLNRNRERFRDVFDDKLRRSPPSRGRNLT